MENIFPVYHEVHLRTIDLSGFGGRLCASIPRCAGVEYVSCYDGSVSKEYYLMSLSLSDTHPKLNLFRSVCFAKHVNDKAAKWAKSKRPRKTRPSDVNRKPIVYEIHSMTKPAEYSISDEAASPAAKPSEN